MGRAGPENVATIVAAVPERDARSLEAARTTGAHCGHDGQQREEHLGGLGRHRATFWSATPAAVGSAAMHVPARRGVADIPDERRGARRRPLVPRRAVGPPPTRPATSRGPSSSTSTTTSRPRQPARRDAIRCRHQSVRRGHEPPRHRRRPRPSSPTTTAAAAPPGGSSGCCGSPVMTPALLDGGLAAWTGPLETGPSPARPAGARSPRPVAARRAGRRRRSGRAGRVRGGRGRRPQPRPLPGRHRTGRRPLPATSRAPLSAPWHENLDPVTGRFLRARAAPGPVRGARRRTGAPVVAYCGSGVSACANLVALECRRLHRRPPVRRLVVGLVGRPRPAGRHRGGYRARR